MNIWQEKKKDNEPQTICHQVSAMDNWANTTSFATLDVLMHKVQCCVY